RSVKKTIAKETATTNGFTRPAETRRAFARNRSVCRARGAAREREDAECNDREQRGRRGEAAEREASVGVRLVEEVADDRAERAREDERRPEREGAADARAEVERRDHEEHRAEDERAPAIPEAGG